MTPTKTLPTLSFYPSSGLIDKILTGCGGRWSLCCLHESDERCLSKHGYLVNCPCNAVGGIDTSLPIRSYVILDSQLSLSKIQLHKCALLSASIDIRGHGVKPVIRVFLLRDLDNITIYTWKEFQMHDIRSMTCSRISTGHLLHDIFCTSHTY